MSLLRTHRARAALGLGALVLTLGSIALAAPSATLPPPGAGRLAIAAIAPVPPTTPASTATSLVADGGTASVPETRADEAPDRASLAQELYSLFCIPYAAIVCAALGDCACHDAVREALCEEHFLGRCELSNLHDALGAERIDRSSIDACLLTLAERAASCAVPAVECPPLATVLARPGERCPAGAPYCDGGRCDDAGICRAWSMLGEDCTETECAPGLVCGDAERCMVLGDVGARCELAMDCRFPLACRGGRCRARGEEGAVCDEEEDCAAGLICDERERCRAADAEQEARPCAAPDECGHERVCAGVYERRCVDESGVLPLPDVGQRCEWLCAVGAYCGAEGRCLRGPSEGQPCVHEGYCGPGLACDFDRTTGRERCVRAASTGEACDRDRPCELDAQCTTSGTCVPRPSEGERCERGVCALGLRCHEVIADGRCVPELCEL